MAKLKAFDIYIDGCLFDCVWSISAADAIAKVRKQYNINYGVITVNLVLLPNLD